MNGEQEIKDALQAFRTAINENDGDAVAASLERLDRLAREAKGGIDPRLLHYLERRSYEKAWEWLSARGGGSARKASAETKNDG